MINVLLVDDHDLVRSGIESLLKAVEGIQVVSVADCGEKAIAAVEKFSPDVVLMDVNMPGIGGLETCRRLLQRSPETKIIALSVHNAGPIPRQILNLGAHGFISKMSKVDEMVFAIRQVVDGKRYISADVASNLAFSTLNGQPDSPFEKLSPRESEIVCMVLQGKTIQEMSESLVLSSKTVNTYRYRIYAKLQVKNDVELTRLAVKYQFIDASLI